jgi:hypothetical protein
VRVRPDMNRAQLLYWGYAAGLVGGVLILASTVLLVLFMAVLGTIGVTMPMWWGQFEPRALGGFAAALMGLLVLLWGVLTGLLVLWGANRTRTGGPNLVPAGVVMIVAGVLSFPVMGGFWVGAMAAIAGGILVILAESPAAAPRPAAYPPSAPPAAPPPPMGP